MSITGGSWSGKTNVLLNVIKHQQPDIDKIYFCDKNPSGLKHQLLINAREKEKKNIKKSNSIH